ncbi:MAG: TolC family protein [Candidatus Eiseniibacteriota bacterium]
MASRVRLAAFLAATWLMFPGATHAQDRPASGADLSEGATAGSETSALDSLLAAPQLDLPLLERAAMARNPTVASMRAAAREMSARADAAGSLDDPMLGLMAAPASFGKSAADAAYSIELTQSFPIFGQRGLRGRAAQAVARSATEEYRAAGQDLVHEARRLYFEFYFAARGIEVNRELSDLLGQFRRVALQKYAAGTAGEQDALQAEVELAMLEHQRVALGRSRRIIVAQLRALLHDETGRDLPDPARELEEPVAGAAYAAAESVAMKQRPELRGRNALWEARQEELRLAERERLPELAFRARYDRFMDLPEWRTAVGLEFNLPIGWGRIGANVRAAEAGLERAENERKAERDRVLAEITEARTLVEETMHEVHIIETSVVPATERALASVRAGYETNRSDFLSLLNAERDLARARLDRYRALAQQGMALADLERAIGIEPAATVGEGR